MLFSNHFLNLLIKSFYAPKKIYGNNQETMTHDSFSLSLSAWMTRMIMINKDSPSSSGSPMIILRMMTRKGHSSSYKKNSYSSHVAVEEGF